MNFSTILFIVTIIVLLGVLYYYYYVKKEPTNLLSSSTYTSSGIGNDVVKDVSMMTPDEIKQFLGENFTLSYYITITNLGGGTPNQFVPLVWIAGVGALVVDMIAGTVYMIITSTPYDPSNTAPTVNTIILTNTDSGKFINKWNQVTLTVSGATVCVYLNGVQIGNCITLPNVPLTAPTGVYFLQGRGPAATIASLQAWPTVLSFSDISIQYKNTSDSIGAPIHVNSAGVNLSDFGTALLSLFCQTGLCPPPSSSDVTLGPFTKINYEYS
jgi:hypothetical protein